MAILILLAILCIPIAEIAVFIKAGEVIGLGWTLALIVLTAVLGATLMRRQGLKVLRQTQQKLDRGEMPVGEALHGLCILAAGALLLTPGFITDTLGLLLFIPPVRVLLGTLVLRSMLRSRHTRVWVKGAEVGPGGRPRPGGGPGGGRVIDGEYTDVTGRGGDERDPPDRIGLRPDAPDSSPWRRS